MWIYWKNISATIIIGVDGETRDWKINEKFVLFSRRCLHNDLSTHSEGNDCYLTHNHARRHHLLGRIKLMGKLWKAFRRFCLHFYFNNTSFARSLASTVSFSHKLLTRNLFVRVHTGFDWQASAMVICQTRQIIVISSSIEWVFARFLCNIDDDDDEKWRNFAMLKPGGEVWHVYDGGEIFSRLKSADNRLV